ncbi:MAG TPA: HK97 family phage prohead protease [Candidatus Cloacimonadota bacterium]|mgnify:CR=1 FL=1|nr:HK97 family phage prohead protease [Candidatus Cloacimonadota bacterium]
MEKIEKRILLDGDIQMRAVEEEGGKRYLEGYAAIFNSRSKLILEKGEIFYEELRQGSFTQVLSNPKLDVYYTLNHERGRVMGRTTNGTLQLKEDETGLSFRVELPNNVSYANDVYELVKRGDLFNMSFAFAVDSEGFKWERTDEGIPLRVINNVRRLVDVSVVTLPAYEETTVQARDLPIFEEKPKQDNIQERMKMKLKI